MVGIDVAVGGQIFQMLAAGGRGSGVGGDGGGTSSGLGSGYSTGGLGGTVGGLPGTGSVGGSGGGWGICNLSFLRAACGVDDGLLNDRITRRFH